MEWRKIFIGITLLIFAATLAWADVIYLKDGSVVKGKIIGSTTGETCKIETADGSVFVFTMDRIESVKLEEERRPEEEASPVDVIYLKDGSVVKGKIVGGITGETCKIETADGSIFVLTMDRIERIKFKKEVPPVEKVIPVRVKEKPALPIQKMPISVGFGLGSFKVEDVEGRGIEWFGDLRYMVRKNFAIQGELRSGKLSGDESIEDLPDDAESTYKYLSYGATGLLFFKLSPENPLVLYGGGGISRYNWDYSTEVSGRLEEVDYWLEMSFKENDWGYHLCGGVEYPISENLFLWGEVRKIIGEIEEPEVTGKIRVDSEEEQFSGKGEDWDYGHMLFRGGLGISF